MRNKREKRKERRGGQRSRDRCLFADIVHVLSISKDGTAVKIKMDFKKIYSTSKKTIAKITQWVYNIYCNKGMAGKE